MSLADEIGKLYELHKMNVLSVEEFTSAKEAAIRRFSSGSATVTAALPATNPPTLASSSDLAPCSQQPPAKNTNEEEDEGLAEPEQELIAFPLLEEIIHEEIESAKRLFPLVDLSALLRYNCCAVQHSTDGFLAALEHLSRICGNIIGHPENTKFHQLRLSNPRLAAELFSVPGAVLLLQSVGFDTVAPVKGVPLSPYQPEQEASTRGEQWLRWRAHEQRQLLPRVEQATAAIAFLREREDGVARHRLSLQRLSQSLNMRRNHNVALDIRLDQARAAHAQGTLADHVARLYKKDDAGDGLYSATKHAQQLSRILHTAVKLFHDEKENESDSGLSDLWLPLDSPAVFAAVVQQKGSLELLLVAAEAALQPLPSAGAASPAPLSCRSTDSALLTEAPVALRFTVAAAGHVEGAAAIASDVAASVQLAQQQHDHAARQAAEAAVKADLRREKLRQAHASDIAESRLQEAVAAHAGRRRRLVNKGGHEESRSSSASSSRQDEEGGGGGTAPSSAGGGKRVPIAEALAILMGRKKCEED